LKHLKSKISKVLVLYIVLFSSVVTLLLTAIQLRIDYNDGIDSIYQRIEQIKLTNLASITQSLWTIDSASTQIQLDGLSRINDIIFVKITDEKNIIVASSGKINTNNTITSDIALNRKYRDHTTTLGTLTVVATKENIYKNLIDTVITILISQAIKTFLVSLFVLIIFYYLVTRHLMKIEQHSGKLELTSKPSTLTLDRSTSILFQDDELEHVVKSINRMTNSIYSSYKDFINKQHDLAEREAKFSAIFDSINDAIVLTDNERKIVQTNPAFISQFGYSTEELQNHTTLMLYANPEEYGTQGKKRYNLETQPETSIYEIEYRRKDGSIFPSETMGGAITLANGKPFGFIGIIRDVSARKQHEKEHNQLQKQLQQSQKMDAIGQLTGGIAHDFNNILASILGYSELAIQQFKQSTDPKLIKYLERINTGGQRASELVVQMLAFSRSTPGELQVIKLPALIDDVTALLRPTIPSSIKLITDIDERTPSVFMDNTQMHQILMNLCINARDAMQGHGTLTLKLSHDADVDALCGSCNEVIQGDYVKLTVEDTGTGIQRNILDKIFDPFLTTKEVGKGTGMGLSVVHGILHKHNSHIIVETELKSGSRFHLLIPPMNEDNNTSDIKQASINSIPQDDGKDKHILVVDDEENVATFLQNFLETYGYNVTAVTSSTHAIDLFKTSSINFDLIITDQTMPEITGTEMIKQIFQITPDIPVILCSGYNELVNEEQALKLGCSKYLDKPINNQLLIQVVHDILHASQNT